jgi:hypothetical protein
MREYNFVKITKEIVFPLISVLLLGFVFIGEYVIDPNNTLFTFTLFGFSTIFFYNLILNLDFKKFVLISLFFTILVLLTLLQTSEVIRNLRNATWFISIGFLAFIIKQIENTTWYKASKMWIVATWFVGFVLIYLFMTLQNIYVYKFYQLDPNYDLLFYFGRSIKLGGLIGFGIGFGLLLSRTNNIVKNIKAV